ncbi:hypothetical protein NM688_g3081 [Phlebia brevispora]|uniref:Uncharacterized protein n=1 Tax=Phlebia brevispora TaxID=194682 RepID=A0ACC1T6U5_9APHY|nr:hypothetical protein NM688_g3081 [Phlebia brevispora]
MAERQPLSIQILRAYYPVAICLQDYLDRTVETARSLHSILIHETDTKQYRDLLASTIVASQQESVITPRLKPSKPLGPLRELIERVQIQHLRHKPPQLNVLTSGYQLHAPSTRGKNSSTFTLPLLQSRYVNTVITAFETQAWATLYDRLGDDIVFHLLADTSIFTSLPNSCYCQITGPPIIDLTPPAALSHLRENENGPTFSGIKRIAEDSASNERSSKRQKSDERTASKSTSAQTHSAEAICRSPVEISVARTRLFYYRLSGPSKISCGVPADHVLNRCRVGTAPSATLSEEVARKQEQNARHLAKYVFPKQFGLTSIFDVQQENTFTMLIPKFANREEEIKVKGSMKTPKRVKQALDLLEKTIWRHSMLDPAIATETYLFIYWQVNTNIKSSLDSSVILEMMSEASFQLNTQGRKTDASVSFSSSEPQLMPQARSQAKQQAQQKPRFAEFICSYDEVYCYAIAATRAVIPMQFWGSTKNFKLIKRHVKTLITMRRFETVNLHTLIQGLSVSECEWLSPRSQESAKNRHVPASDSLKRLEVLQEFVHWYFDSFLVSLLKTAFYVTESQAFRNKVLYFRQDDWEVLCRPLVERLCAGTFQKLRREDAEEILRQRRLGYSFVRLLPKETGVRPIINLRRREANTPYKRSINQILKAAFHILTYEKEHRRKLVGAAIFGPNEIYQKLKGFKATLQRDFPQGLPKLYFVKMDVQACFDTIDQTKLLHILVEVLKEEQYTIQRHGRVSTQCTRVTRNFVSTAVPTDEYPHFLALASQLASALRNTIFVDKVVYPDAKRREIIELLEQHITDNIVKIGDDYYRQVVGIPQGSILSTLLCSFFYGDLEKTRLKFAEDKHTILLRLVDDYLLVTTDRGRARKFYDVMVAGHPDYGCFISQDKTLTNFDDGDMFNVIDPSQGGFPWCGFLINMRDLSVSTDFSRWSASTLRESFTVDLGRRPGAAFAHKMLAIARSKSHIIYNDCRLNSLASVYKNIYESFCLAAVKMHYYIRSWKPDMAKSSPFITSDSLLVHSDEKRIDIKTLEEVWRKTGSAEGTGNMDDGLLSDQARYPRVPHRAVPQIPRTSGSFRVASRPRVAMRTVLRLSNQYRRCAIWSSPRVFFSPVHKAVSAAALARPLLLPSLRAPVPQSPNSTRAFATASTMSESPFYQLKAEQPGGKTFDFSELKGKVVLIVNVASKCYRVSSGFTPQYKGLEELYEKYKEKGFVILGFPCNQFGGQEPGTDEEIAQFCSLNHGVTFPLMKKSDVNGDNTNEVYKYLKEQKSGLLGLTRIKWNFEKFLVDREGKVVHRWASTTAPDSIDAAVEKLL